MTTEFSFWLVLPALLLAATAAWFLYRNNPLRLEGKQGIYIQRALAVVRFVLIFFILLLLIGPVIQLVHEKIQKPTVVIAIDNSASINQQKNAGELATKLASQINALQQSLNANYDVVTYTFDHEIAPFNNELTFSGKSTNVSQALRSIKNRFEDQNLGAVVLVSDGIYNQGEHPLGIVTEMRTPVYTFLLGDTTARKDLYIKNVRYNQVAFAGNDLALQIDLAAYDYQGSTTQLNISTGGKIISSKKIQLQSRNYFETHQLIVPITGEGTQVYQINVEPLSGERTLANNSFTAYVTVLSNKQNILLLAHAPHPDLAAMKKIIENTDGYTCQLAYINDVSGVKSADAYSMVILHQLPGWRGEGQKLIEQFKTRNMPLLYVLGAFTGLNTLSSLEPSFRIQFRNQSMNEVVAVPNTQFNLFSLDENEKNLLSKMPPLLSPFASYSVAGDHEVLMTQQIGYVKTAYPLWFFLKGAANKTAFICGEGIWKWQLADFNLSEQQTVSKLVQKTIQFLSNRKDQSRFRINMSNRFEENEPVTVDAEVYNESYELMNNAEVTLTLLNEKGKQFNYTFSQSGSGYSLQMGVLAPGKYTYVAKASAGQQTLESKGSFHVVPLQLEFAETRANAQLMREMAAQSQAKSGYVTELEKAATWLNENTQLKPLIEETKDQKSWIDLPWLFFLLLALFTLEWSVRKWHGSI